MWTVPASPDSPVAAVLDEHLGHLVGRLTDVLGQQRRHRHAQVALAVRRVLEELAVLATGSAEAATMWELHSMAMHPQRLVRGRCRDPAVGRRPRDHHVVAPTDLQRTEHGLDAGAAALDVHALVADRVAVPRAGLGRHDVAEPHVLVAQQQPPAGHRVRARRPPPRRRASCGFRCLGSSGWLGVSREVAQVPLAHLVDGRGDVAVVEQRGVGEEALLAHELLEVQAAVLAPMLDMPLRGDVPDHPVVRHHRSFATPRSRVR